MHGMQGLEGPVACSPGNNSPLRSLPCQRLQRGGRGGGGRRVLNNVGVDRRVPHNVNGSSAFCHTSRHKILCCRGELFFCPALCAQVQPGAKIIISNCWCVVYDVPSPLVHTSYGELST